MRFILGLLVGYCIRGKQRLLIATLTAIAVGCFIVLPAIALPVTHDQSRVVYEPNGHIRAGSHTPRKQPQTNRRITNTKTKTRCCAPE
jgi:hypothetical protein